LDWLLGGRILVAAVEQSSAVLSRAGVGPHLYIAWLVNNASIDDVVARTRDVFRRELPLRKMAKKRLVLRSAPKEGETAQPA
jgi:hypothetical protein